MFSKKLLAGLIFWVGMIYPSFSQILDDSTKVVYGVRTTNYYKEEDILNNIDRKYSVDTTLDGIHNFPYLYGQNTFYQDLGNLGTPVNLYGYTMPDRIGRRYGYDSFDPYTFLPKNIRFYDTKSPYSEVKYIQGGKGQQLIDLTFSRNIWPHWNFGFDYRRYVSKKTLGFARKSNQSLGNSFDMYTRFYTPNKRYQVLASFSFSENKQYETGGIKPQPFDTKDSLFDGINEEAYLFLPSTPVNAQARSQEKRFYYNVYQELDILPQKLLQVYDRVGFTRRFNWFKQINQPRDTAFFIDNNISFPGHFDNYSTFNNTGYSLYENEGGLKGSFEKFTYRGYYRTRSSRYYQGYTSGNISIKEQFVGARAQYAINDSTLVFVEGEQLIGGTYFNSSKDQSLKAEFWNKYLGVGFNRLVYSPSMFQFYYQGNYQQWNDFNDSLRPTETNRLFATIKFERPRFFVRVNADYYTIKNYIYLNSNGIRAQTSEDQQTNLLSIAPELGVNYRNVYLENYSRIYQKSGKNGGETVLNVPQLLNRTRIYFLHAIKNANSSVQVGIDFNYRSSYFVDKYMPLYAHYYLNDDVKLSEYFYADLFVAFKIKQFTVSLKYEQVTQGLGPFAPGYFITPDYAGMPRVLIFGINWKFYN